MTQEHFQQHSCDLNMKYDFYSIYPKSRRNSVIGSIFMILFTILLYVLSDFKIVFLVIAIVFSAIGFGIIINIKKNQIITFTQQRIVIDWFTLMKRINEEVIYDQINFIQFKTFTYDKETSNYNIIIQTYKKQLKLTVTPAQFYDLMPYFEKFCDANNIKLVGCNKNIDEE